MNRFAPPVVAPKGMPSQYCGEMMGATGQPESTPLATLAPTTGN